MKKISLPALNVTDAAQWSTVLGGFVPPTFASLSQGNGTCRSFLELGAHAVSSAFWIGAAEPARRFADVLVSTVQAALRRATLQDGSAAAVLFWEPVGDSGVAMVAVLVDPSLDIQVEPRAPDGVSQVGWVGNDNEPAGLVREAERGGVRLPPARAAALRAALAGYLTDSARQAAGVQPVAGRLSLVSAG